MNQFQQELQALSLNDYQSGNVVYWDQQNQYPYYYIEDAARRCGGCGGRCGGGRCGGFSLWWISVCFGLLRLFLFVLVVEVVAAVVVALIVLMVLLMLL